MRHYDYKKKNLNIKYCSKQYLFNISFFIIKVVK